MVDQKNSWTEAFKKKSFLVQLIVFIISILTVVLFLPSFFHTVIGPKTGIRMNDLLLNLFTPRDNSWIIFGLIYLSLVIILQGIYRKPDKVLLGLKCYLILNVLRMASMYIITLEAPEGIIPLHDPLVDVIAYGGNPFDKDLFFSGHIATLSLFVLLEERPTQKKIVLMNTLLVAGLILLQRVHYTIDVMVAPLIAYWVVRGTKRIDISLKNRLNAY